MDRRDYLPSSPFYRFGMALLASPVNGVAIRERLAVDSGIPPGGETRLRFPEGVADPPIEDAEVAEAIRRFAAHYPAYLAAAELSPEWVAEFAVVVIRSASGRLRFRAEIRNSMGRWLLVQLVFSEQRSAELPSQSATNDADSHAT
ncbi:hypothetical protein [Tuwongella immobilis]|uniref:Uncharacterized protein n=1 Tax=Tuwongella immobilis TaxID=692036 RepID=A0A6C2YIB1_9BACT|nr:hypothetical protein [Tuwongella immobilis]VIP01157.1 unnamed protein product [Tuwongella immobilis]VTR97740.1 unnamed protein product [Tuwongella immobilis]